MSGLCDTCETTMCGGACARMEKLELPKPLVRRVVVSCLSQMLSEDGACRVTQDELELYRNKTQAVIDVGLPTAPRLVVDMTMVHCGCGCEEQVFEVQAKDLGWDWGTFLPGGNSAWRCRESARADADNPLF